MKKSVRKYNQWEYQAEVQYDASMNSLGNFFSASLPMSKSSTYWVAVSISAMVVDVDIGFCNGAGFTPFSTRFPGLFYQKLLPPYDFEVLKENLLVHGCLVNLTLDKSGILELIKEMRPLCCLVQNR